VLRRIVAAMALVLGLGVAAAIPMGDDPPKKPGTPGVTVLVAGGGGCQEFMCGTNHNQVTL
jgi:hypothetical protein